MALTLGDALFTKTQQRVLGLFFSVPDARFYTNDILRRLEMGRGIVLRELDKLAQVGILSRTREGNQNYYQADASDQPHHLYLGRTQQEAGAGKQFLKPGYGPTQTMVEGKQR